MSNQIDHFCNELNNLDPEKSNGLVADLYDLVDIIEKEEDISLTFKPIFDFFEKFPNEDLGIPGPLVHLLENHYPKYMLTLLSSIKNKPTYMSVQMLNRVMNSDLPEEKRENYLSLLQSVALSDSDDLVMKENALEIYNNHIQKGS